MDKLSKKYLKSKSIYVFTSDNLEDLPPRNLFKDRLIQSIAFARRYNFKVGVISIDLNTFEENPSKIDVSDEILKKVGQRIVKALRETDTVSSQGLDEFLVIIPDVPEEGNEMLVAQKILKLINSPMKINNKEMLIKPYIGVTLYPDDAQTPDQIITRANIAVEEARNKKIPIVRLQKIENVLPSSQLKQI
jgi:diguanylate cyclase (GGDEF)-like protein